MKTLVTGIFAGVVLCGVAFAQSTTPAPQSNDTAPQRQQSPQATQSTVSNSEQKAEAPKIAPGSVIPVELTKSIDAKKVKTGDEVDAKVTQDLKAQDGEVVVPKDTKVIGHVTQAQARTKTQKESEIGIAFDHEVMKNGSAVELPMSIQAIIAPPTQNAGNNSGIASPGPPPSEPGAGTASGASGPAGSSNRSTGMASEAPTPSASGGGWPTGAQTQAHANPSITGDTKGVVGISNLQLSAATNQNDGSVVTSEKSNVKLDSGTLLLLRVNQ